MGKLTLHINDNKLKIRILLIITCITRWITITINLDYSSDTQCLNMKGFHLFFIQQLLKPFGVSPFKLLLIELCRLYLHSEIVLPDSICTSFELTSFCVHDSVYYGFYISHCESRVCIGL